MQKPDVWNFEFLKEAYFIVATVINKRKLYFSVIFIFCPYFNLLKQK